MKIIIDGMGGDNAPFEILKGCALAVKELCIDIIITGNESLLKQTMLDNNIISDNITVIDAPDILTMDDEPMSVVKDKKNSSMGVALNLLKEGKGDALVSAGNSGSLLAGGTLVIKRIKGIKRAAFAPIFPTEAGYVMLIDSGATIECKPEFLNQYGIMGSAYMRSVYNIESPRVGLANNGAEECKGTDLYIEAYKLLKKNTSINFVGNIEGRGIMMGECDVLVSDGFTGNLILKSIEGMGIFFMKSLRKIFYANPITRLSSLLLLKQIKIFKKKLDYKETGGAVLLGLTKPIIKAHGSSDARAIKNSIRQAVKIAKSNIEDIIIAAIESDCQSSEQNSERESNRV